MVIRILAIVACGAAGHFARSAFDVSSRGSVPVRAPEWPASLAELKMPTAAESGFIAEWERLRAAHGDDNAAIYAAIQDGKDLFRQRAFRSAFIAEWSVSDPRAALVYLLEKDGDRAVQLAREWMRRDPQGAVTGLIAGGEKTRGLLRAMLIEIAEVAPSRLVEALTTFEKAEFRLNTRALDAFATFAAKDFAAARSAAESATGEFRGQALAGVAKVWAEKDGAASLAWVQAMPAGEERDRGLRAVLLGWAKTDPVAALDRLDVAPPGGGDRIDRSDTGAAVLREAAKKDWDATIAWLRDHPGKVGRNSLGGLQEETTHRLRVDTAGTMRLLATGALPGLDRLFGNALVNDGYAQRDVIWTWLEGQPPGDQTTGLRASLLNAIGRKEPEVALGILDQIADTPENEKVFAQGVSSIVNFGSMDQFGELLAKASPKLRPRLIEQATIWSADTVGADPALWIERLNEIPAKRRDRAIRNLAEAWATNYPEAAVRWTSSLPEGDARDGAFGGIAATWAESDPHEAARWVDTLPPGAGRDNAAESIVDALAKSEPEAAWAWAASIQSPEQRTNALLLAYASLIKKDPALAEETLASAGLPEAEITALRESFKPGKDK